MTTFVKDKEHFWKPMNNAMFILAILFLFFNFVFVQDIYSVGKLLTPFIFCSVLFIKDKKKFTNMHFWFLACNAALMSLGCIELNKALILAGIVSG